MTNAMMNQNNNLPNNLLEQIMNTQNAILEFMQTTSKTMQDKTDKDEERDQKIDVMGEDIKFLKYDNEISHTQWKKMDKRRKARVYEMFGKDADKRFKGIKVFGVVLVLQREKVRQRAELANPMNSTAVKDYQEVMDAFDAVEITREEVENEIEKRIANREKNNQEWFKNNK